MSNVFRRERATEFCELVENLLISSLQLSKTFEKSLKRGAGSRCGLNGGKFHLIIAPLSPSLTYILAQRLQKRTLERKKAGPKRERYMFGGKSENA